MTGQAEVLWMDATVINVDINSEHFKQFSLEV
jgi:hypothetical protein